MERMSLLEELKGKLGISSRLIQHLKTENKRLVEEHTHLNRQLSESLAKIAALEKEISSVAEERSGWFFIRSWT